MTHTNEWILATSAYRLATCSFHRPIQNNVGSSRYHTQSSSRLTRKDGKTFPIYVARRSYCTVVGVSEIEEGGIFLAIHQQPSMENSNGSSGPSDSSHEDAHEHNSELHSLSLAYQTYMRHDKEEADHFEDVCRAFRQYAAFAMSSWANQQYRLHSLPEAQRNVLPEALKGDTPHFKERASRFKDSAIRNQFCVDCILRHAGVHHSQEVTSRSRTASDSSMSKVSSVLRSLARDWSADGEAERNMAYTPILRQVQKFLPIKTGQPAPRICVPGSGMLETIQ